ncbi:MAG: hypothetical protein KGL46_02895 [Hyphomicrobiales bacterium]|nr:hypothetical protein [Hyphomicrobiales bacterium]
MSYLDPPPMPAPVVVTKDVGGLVRAYQDRTELYRMQNREVRLHECRSACTLALSLPNVCVYPNSILKFHQAYNDVTKETDAGVTYQLWSAYPAPVRARLGGLTRQYKVLRGAELIALGFRNCRGPSRQQPILVARARPQPAPEGGDLLKTVSSWFGGAPSATRPALVATRESRADGAIAPRAEPAPARARADANTPPVAPAASPRPLPPPVQPVLQTPLPPPRPKDIGVADLPAPVAQPAPRETPAFLRPIPGSAPILEARFVVARR